MNKGVRGQRGLPNAVAAPCPCTLWRPLWAGSRQTGSMGGVWWSRQDRVMDFTC